MPRTSMVSMKLLVRLVVAALALVLVAAATGASVVAYTWTTADVDTLGRVDFDRPLQIPPLETGTVTADGTRVFDLTLQGGTSDFGHGPATRTWGFDGSYLGPTLRAARGDKVRVDVTNQLGETSTVHWHGMRLPAAMDGGPHQVVDAGDTWSPTWTIDQPAASLWYHPHLHGATAQHVYRGLAGMFLVDDPADPTTPGARALPQTYGVDDIPLIVQDKKFDGDQLDENPGVFGISGTVGDEILVNGTPGPFLDVTTEAVRLRLLNASNARVFDFSFESGQEFALVGTDGGLLERPTPVRNVQLSPGERAEIVVRPVPGSRDVLRSTPPALGSDFFQSRFSGGDDSFDILEMRAAPELAPSTALPDRLTTFDEFGEPSTTRRIDLNGTNMINGRTVDMTRIDDVVPAGATEMWEVRNASSTHHNFHIHDVQFTVVDATGTRNDRPLLAGRKDTVFVPPNSTVRLLVRFGEHSDPAMPYMYHCHLLWHEDSGMMGQFVVVGPDDAARVDGVTDHSSTGGHGTHG